MRQRARVCDLVIGERYILSNNWHPECEYGDIWYVGTSYNKYGDVVYCFSETEVEIPDGYDGNASNLWFSGPLFDEAEIAAGNVALA